MSKKIRYILCLSAFLTACSSKTSTDILDITIKDLTAPTITIKKKSYSITEGDSFKIKDCYSVSDNLTKAPTVDVDDDGFSNKNAGIYTIKITATDESGNAAEDSFEVEVKEKPKPTPAPTPTPEAKKNSNSNNSSRNHSSTQSNSSPVQQETQSQPQQEQVQQNITSDDSYSEPTIKTDGPYEDANACQMAARSKGALSYKCYDQNGQTYLEWEE